jgi:hypothetical protein
LRPRRGVLKRRIPAIAHAESSCCGAITVDGERLLRFLDDSGVDHLWLAGFRVNWQTGVAVAAWPAGTGSHTVAQSRGVADGWHMLPDVVTAQAEANGGTLVMAVFANPNLTKPGHIAIIRPGLITPGALAHDGPMITQAGGHNALAAALAESFRNHPGACMPGGAVRFFAHDVAWMQITAPG